MAIANDIIEKIQEKVDIVDIISGYIPLKKSGRNFKANCPFHKEKTPSFMVNQDKQIYHCFGCGVGGNVFSFLMKYEGIDFPEAVQMVAAKAGISLPAMTGERRNQTVADQLYKLNEMACAFYQTYLAGDSRALAYLNDRGIGSETISRFRLGLAPDSWDGLIQYFRRKNIDASVLEKAGLAVHNPKKNSYYDLFRNRIIIPIFDIRGRVVGFGARILDSGEPKYINSPETYVYSKGRNLYGLNFTKEAVKENQYAVLVEGYFDCMVPFQAGVKNIVATLGTALTQDQIRLLKRFIKTVVMVYDPDEAGESATVRNLDLFIAEGVNVYVATLKAGCDPDNFIREYGLEEFKQALKSAKNLFDYKLGLLCSRYNQKDIHGKVAIASEMLPTISRIDNEILKTSLIKKLAEHLLVSEEALRIELGKVKPDYQKPQAPQPEQKKSTASVLGSAEKMLLALMLEETRFIERVKSSVRLEEFTDDYIRTIVKTLFALYMENKDISHSRLINYLNSSDEASTIVSEVAVVNEIVSDKERVIEDCIRKIKDDFTKKEMMRLQTEIQNAHNAQDDSRLQELVIQYNELLTVKHV